MDKPEKEKSEGQELKEFLDNLFSRQKPADETASAEEKPLAAPGGEIKIALWTTDVARAETFTSRFAEALQKVATRKFSFTVQVINLTEAVINWDNILLRSKQDYHAQAVLVLAESVPAIADIPGWFVRGFRLSDMDKRYSYIDLAVDFLLFAEKLNVE